MTSAPAPRAPPSTRRARAAASLRATAIAKADTARSRVTAERVAFGLTGAALAQRAGVFPSQVAALETGRDAPREADTGEWRSVAVAVADALGMTPAELWPEHAPKVPRLPCPEAAPRPDDLYLAAETSARLRAAIAQLPPRDAAVIALRFALNDGDPMLFSDVGAAIGVSRERARQIEQQALARLATLLREHRP